MYPEFSFKLLLFLQNKYSETNSYVEYIDYHDKIDNEDRFLYIESEKRLIIDYSLKKKIISEICEFLSNPKSHINLNLKNNYENNKKTSIFGNFCISDSIEETVEWDLLTLLILIDSYNLKIWDNRPKILEKVLNNNLINIQDFLLNEIYIIRFALCYTIKLGHIWCYLEHITLQFYNRININKDQNSSEMTKIKDILDFHSDFVYKQIKLYKHNYYVWSFINWIFFKLIPQLLYKNNSKFQFEENTILLIEDWTTKLLLSSPLEYGGYHTLLNIIEYKFKILKNKDISAIYLFEVAYSSQVLKIINIVVNFFSDYSTDFLTILLNFRYGIILLLNDLIKPNFHIQILENEIQWFIENKIFEKIINMNECTENIDQYFESIIYEISNNSDDSIKFINLIKSKMPFLNLSDCFVSNIKDENNF